MAMSSENMSNRIGFIVQMPICGKNTALEVNSDFSLPDYQPEIRRLLNTRVNVLPPSEYVGSDSVEFSGEIKYHLLYIGGDGELYSTVLSDTYGFTVPFDEVSQVTSADSVCVVENTEAESVVSRVLAPRKLNIRLKLRSEVKAFAPVECNAARSGAAEADSVQELVCEAPVRNIRRLRSEPAEVSDFINIDTSQGNIRIIDHDCKVLVTEALPYQEKVNCKGEIWVKIIYCNDDDDQILTVNKKIPFSCVIDGDGIDNTFECCAQGYTLDERFEIEESGVSCEITVDVIAEAQKNDVFYYVRDSYSTVCKSECTYHNITVPKAVRCINGNMTQNEAVPISKLQMPKDAKIIDASGNAQVRELTLESGKAVIKGECNYQILYRNGDEYGIAEHTLPFRYEGDLRLASNEKVNDPEWTSRAKVISSRVRSDDERVCIDAELFLLAEIGDRETVNVLTEISFGEEISKCRSEVLICYPEKGKTVWEVSKQYAERPERIRAENNIPESEQLIKKKFLVI